MRNELLSAIAEPLYLMVMLAVMTFSFIWSFIPAVGSCQELLSGLTLPAWVVPVSHLLSLIMFSGYMASKAGKWAVEEHIRNKSLQEQYERAFSNTSGTRNDNS